MINLLLYALCGSLLIGQIWGVFVPEPIPLFAHDLVVVAILVSSIGLLRRKLYQPQLLRPILAFGVVGLISLLLSSGRFTLPELLQSFLYLVRWATYAVFYLICVQPGVKKSILLKGLVGTGMGFTILGFIQYFWYPDLRNLMYLGWDPHLGRMFASLFDPNFLGIVLVISIFITGYVYLTERKLLWAVVAVVETVALFLTYSRSSLLAFAAGLTVFCFMRKQWWVLVGFCVIVPVALLLLPKSGYEGTKLERVTSVTARFGNIERAVPLFTSSPIIGWGFNTTRALALKEQWWDQSVATSRAAGSIDNSLVVILVTTGVVGLGVYGWLLYNMGKLGTRLTKKQDKLWGSIYIAVLVAIVVHSQFINSLFYPWVLIPLWLLTAYTEKTHQ